MRKRIHINLLNVALNQIAVTKIVPICFASGVILFVGPTDLKTGLSEPKTYSSDASKQTYHISHIHHNHYPRHR